MQEVATSSELIIVDESVEEPPAFGDGVVWVPVVVSGRWVDTESNNTNATTPTKIMTTTTMTRETVPIPLPLPVTTMRLRQRFLINSFTQMISLGSRS
jgi:hypothetical protein